MSNIYNPKEVEKIAQEYWYNNKSFKAVESKNELKTIGEEEFIILEK